MVSRLSSRMLGGAGDSNSSSHSEGSSKKRPFVSDTRPESSISGYSADREGPSMSPPVLSIDFHGRDKGRNDGDNNCPKRQKRYEMQYAASTVKADLARAGKDMHKIDKATKNTSCLGNVNIDLKGVKLMHSKDVESSLVTSDVRAQSSLYDYETLVRACLDSYPSSYTLLKDDKGFSPTPSSDISTSSVSDSESDSISSNGNSGNQSLLIPPILEDSFDATKQPSPFSNIKMNSCNVISCPSNAVTMSEMLQLSGTARLVTLSSAPFTIVHANRAFLHFSEAAPNTVLGAPFSSILDSGLHTELAECMMASSIGDHKKFYFKTNSSSGKPIESCFKVSPIVPQRSANREVTTVTHFAIELTRDSASSRGPSLDTVVGKLKLPPNTALGVMG